MWISAVFDTSVALDLYAAWTDPVADWMKDLSRSTCKGLQNGFLKPNGEWLESYGIDDKCRWRALQSLIYSGVGILSVLLLTLLGTRLKLVRNFLDGLYRFGGFIAALFLIGMLLIICAQMAARWLGIAFPGSTNYAGYAMAGAAFFGLAYSLNAGAHIRVGIFLNALGRHRGWGELWCLLIGALLATYFTRYAIKATILSEKLNDISQGQDAMPLWIPQLAMCGGALLLTIALWDNFFRQLFSKRSNIVSEETELLTADA